MFVGPAVIMGTALVARVPGFFHQLFDSDEGAIATVGMVVTRGGTVYRDVIDRKPPLPGFLYAASFLLTGGRDLRPIHVLAALCLGAAAVVLALGARRMAGATAGWWAAGLLLTGATALRPTDAQAANFAHFALLPSCGAIVAARAGSRRSALLAGALVGVATLTRQTWIIGVVPAAFAAWWCGGRRWERPALVVATTAATIAAIGIVVPFGAFWHWTFSGNGSVLDVSESQYVITRGGFAVFVFLLANAATCWLVARRGWHRSDTDLWIWLVTGLLAFVAGFRFFGHYWLQVLPPLCLLAAAGVAKVPAPRRRVLIVVAVVPAIAAWTIALTSPPTRNGRVFALAAYVQTHTRPGDLVTVWGTTPELYWVSGRSPGGALVTTDFITGRSAGRVNGRARLKDATPGALDAFLDSLRAHPPALFLDTSTASLRQYESYPMSLFPRLDAFVRHRYRKVGRYEKVTVYRLRSS
jgi:hypothetical protein